MKAAYSLMITGIACLSGCCGGGGSTAAETADSAIISADCTATEMSFTIGNASENELIVKNMSFTETSPGIQSGNVAITFSVRSLGKEIVGETEMTGMWYTTTQPNGEGLISIPKIQAQVGSIAINYEAYQLGIQILHTEKRPDGRPASRNAVFTQGTFRVWINGESYPFNATDTAVQIDYKY